MKHPHAEVIKAWADGEPVEVYNSDSCKWHPCPDPEWRVDCTYRIKPEEAVRYTVVSEKGNVGGAWFETTDMARHYYAPCKTDLQGFVKRTTVDGKVVKMEFIPK